MEDVRSAAARVFRRILKDIEVELKEEYDRNFERSSYFSEAWPRRKSPVVGSRSGHLLIDSGRLRGSIRSEVGEDFVTFWSDLPYSGIHNSGGEIVVTARMRRYFWAKYREHFTGDGTGKNGWGRGSKTQLEPEEAFWRMMALKKVGDTVTIPRRQFLGGGAEVEKLVRRIVEDGLREYFEHEFSVNIGSR